MPNICPILLHIKTAKNYDTSSQNDTFMSDRFIILHPERLTYIRAIKVNTDIPIAVRILSCHIVKNREPNYCGKLRNEKATAIICDDTKGNIVRFIHFHITSRSDAIRPVEYLLGFIEACELQANRTLLLEEFKKTINWLGSDKKRVACTIFTYGEPAFQTSNIRHSNEVDDIEVQHIKISSKEFLTISQSGRRLQFTDS
jgi:hypothetical protein